jgi:hypothetical protein
MKKLLTIGLLLMSSIASAANLTYVVGTSQVVQLHALSGNSQPYPIAIDVPVGGVYDLNVLGVTHNGNPKSPSPGVRRDFHTTVDAASVLTGPTGAAIPLTAEVFPTMLGMSGYGSRISATKVQLEPGIYFLDLVTSCNTLCSYFQNYFTIQVSPSK